MRTPRLSVVDCTDAPADLNGLVRFAETHALNKATPATTKQMVYEKEELSSELRGDLNAWSRHELRKI